MRLAVFEPDIPQNLGAMIRTAACFGIAVDVIEPCGFPFSVKALRRSAMDYAALAEICHHPSWDGFLASRKASGRLVLMTTKAAEPIWSFGFRDTDTLIMGRESAGVPPHVHDRADRAIGIPMPGGGRSLNVSVAAGIAMAEARRQLHEGSRLR